MAEMEVEYTADSGGREIIYRVHVHSEVFRWLTVTALVNTMADQFKEHLEDTLCEIKKESE